MRRVRLWWPHSSSTVHPPLAHPASGATTTTMSSPMVSRGRPHHEGGGKGLELSDAFSSSDRLASVLRSIRIGRTPFIAREEKVVVFRVWNTMRRRS